MSWFAFGLGVVAGTLGTLVLVLVVAWFMAMALDSSQ